MGDRDDLVNILQCYIYIITELRCHYQASNVILKVSLLRSALLGPDRKYSLGLLDSQGGVLYIRLGQQSGLAPEKAL